MDSIKRAAFKAAFFIKGLLLQPRVKTSAVIYFMKYLCRCSPQIIKENQAVVSQSLLTNIYVIYIMYIRKEA